MFRNFLFWIERSVQVGRDVCFRFDLVVGRRLEALGLDVWGGRHSEIQHSPFLDPKSFQGEGRIPGWIGAIFYMAAWFQKERGFRFRSEVSVGVDLYGQVGFCKNPPRSKPQTGTTRSDLRFADLGTTISVGCSNRCQRLQLTFHAPMKLLGADVS